MKNLVLLSLLLLLAFVWSSVGRAAQPQKIPDQLWKNAQEKGTVRVIVGLNIPWQPEGHLSDSATRAQRNAIAESQQALISQLSGTRYKVIGQFKFIPGIALEVDSAALRVLDHSPHVDRVTEDYPGKPNQHDVEKLQR